MVDPANREAESLVHISCIFSFLSSAVASTLYFLVIMYNQR